MNIDIRKFYNTYFEPNPNCKKEAITLWSSWLGIENLYKLDEVTIEEWDKFNQLLRLIFKKYEVYKIKNDFSIQLLQSVDLIILTYENAMNKPGDKFDRLLIPSLNCVIEESWDYTYLIWYYDDYSVENLSPIIKEAGLYHFKS